MATLQYVAGSKSGHFEIIIFIYSFLFRYNKTLQFSDLIFYLPLI